MTDMIERAARAACGAGWEGDPDTIDYSGVITDVARAALLAALDPEDDDTVNAVARTLYYSRVTPTSTRTDAFKCPDGWAKKVREEQRRDVRVVIEALQRMTQGGSNL